MLVLVGLGQAGGTCVLGKPLEGKRLSSMGLFSLNCIAFGYFIVINYNTKFAILPTLPVYHEFPSAINCFCNVVQPSQPFPKHFHHPKQKFCDYYMIISPFPLPTAHGNLDLLCIFMNLPIPDFACKCSCTCPFVFN